MINQRCCCWPSSLDGEGVRAAGQAAGQSLPRPTAGAAGAGAARAQGLAAERTEGRPAFPANFGSLADARAFCQSCFTYYNHEHRHSGIALYTPASVHFGTAARSATGVEPPCTPPTPRTCCPSYAPTTRPFRSQPRPETAT